MLYIDKATILKFDLEMLKKPSQSNPVYCRAAVYRRVAVYQFSVRLWRHFKHSSGCIINLLGHCAYCRAIQQPQS